MNTILLEKIAQLESRLTTIHHTLKGTALASSLGMEDQVITDVIARLHLNQIDIFVLDTGRLHNETLAVIATNKIRYGITMAVYTPHTESVLAYINQHGENAFYEHIDLRKQCCNIRKVEPLRRALHNKPAWITGQRREQGITRTELPFEELDSVHQIRKFNPLADWTLEDIKAYISHYTVPINALHARNYPSIGCEPCTRAIKPGEDQRAGRWWWENANNKECGLHKA